MVGLALHELARGGHPVSALTHDPVQAHHDPGLGERGLAFQSAARDPLVREHGHLFFCPCCRALRELLLRRVARRQERCGSALAVIAAASRAQEWCSQSAGLVSPVARSAAKNAVVMYYRKSLSSRKLRRRVSMGGKSDTINSLLEIRRAKLGTRY